MEIPSLVRSRLGEEDIQTAVGLGGEDILCFTPTRALLYRGEGLLSDEGVKVFSHDVERLDLSEGRRKTEFTLEYVDGVESFSVPSDKTAPILQRLLDGVLGAAGVTEAGESVTGVFRFSELTLAVTDRRMVKHVGTYVWEADYEEYPFEEVTGLEFEDGSVATSVVLSVGGRPERIKAPNDQARHLRETLEEALFAFHDVASLEALNEKVSPDDDDEKESKGGLTMNEGISPLVDDESKEAETEGLAAGDTGSGTEPESESERAAVDRVGEDGEGGQTARSEPTSSAGIESQSEHAAAEKGGGSGESGIDPEEFADLKSEVAELRQAIDRQSDLIEQQRETVAKLIKELRQGR